VSLFEGKRYNNNSFELLGVTYFERSRTRRPRPFGCPRGASLSETNINERKRYNSNNTRTFQTAPTSSVAGLAARRHLAVRGVRHCQWQTKPNVRCAPEQQYLHSESTYIDRSLSFCPLSHGFPTVASLSVPSVSCASTVQQQQQHRTLQAAPTAIVVGLAACHHALVLGMRHCRWQTSANTVLETGKRHVQRS
jgi:hypothetical protein